MLLVSSSFFFYWIGGQFPVDNFLSYGRILTLHYYYLLICILFSRSDVVHSVHSSGSPRSLILTNEGPKDRSEVGWVVNERNEREWTTRRTEHGKHRQLGSRSSPYVIHAPFLSSPYPSETGARMSVASRALRVPSLTLRGRNGGKWRKEGTEHDEPTKRRGNGPDCYQRLEFFIQVLRVLCPNLTDASHPPFTPFPSRIVRFHTFTSQYAPQAGSDRRTLRGGNVENGAGIIWGVSRQFPRFLSSYHRFLSTGIILLVTSMYYP